MAKKNEETQNVNTEFHQRIINLLKENGYKDPRTDMIAIYVENDSDDALIEYNCMSTSVHLSKKSFSETDVYNAGFKYWPTYNCHI